MSRALQRAEVQADTAAILGPLDEPGITFTSTGLIIDPSVSYEQWERYGRKLQLAEKGIQWALGDWMIHGETHFKERASQAVEFTGLKLKTLQNYATVAESVEKSRRRDSDVVDFSTHAEVASLSAKQQERLLAKAERDNLTSREVRREATRLKRQEGKQKSELEIILSPEVQEFLDRYITQLKELESLVPLTAAFLRNMVQAHIGQAQWQKERCLDSDCEVILEAIDEYNGISDDDLFTWLQNRGYFMRDPELDERLEHMLTAKMISETDAGSAGKQDERRGKLPTFYIRYFKKRPKLTTVGDEDDAA